MDSYERKWFDINRMGIFLPDTTGLFFKVAPLPITIQAGLSEAKTRENIRRNKAREAAKKLYHKLPLVPQAKHTRLRPLLFAWYKAASALETNSSMVLPSSGN